MPDLTFTAEELTKLAAAQELAANQLGKASSDANEVGHSTWITHGLICGATKSPLTEVEHARRAAGKALSAVSVDMAAKLRTAVELYSGTDQVSADNLSNQI
ncbi:ESX-1 secretion-associated protein [Mycobacterium sp.]|uniref:ESX-1 secretion-associated protein n=1 Tax=Mycobacterium sp. TaxID=1785 RepID=UPI00257CC924|nr:ESX-1 secretion-associated protein [Mycobacterium sp.]